MFEVCSFELAHTFIGFELNMAFSKVTVKLQVSVTNYSVCLHRLLKYVLICRT